MQHVWFRDSINSLDVCGRDSEIDQMTKYCDSENSITPLVVNGGTGTGKTALMMQFMTHYADRYVCVFVCLFICM